MNTYTISRVETPDWEKIPVLSLQETGWLAPSGISAKAQLCHNGKALFVRMEAEEKNIRATLTNPMDQVCDDSCLEFFFAPGENEPRYFNFEMNPLGNFFMGIGLGRLDRVRLVPLDPSPFQIRTYYKEDGWGVTYQIPLEFIRLYSPNFSFTGKAACNFYKCGDQTVVPHYLSWNKMTSAQPDYHRRGDFGQLIFE